MKRLLLYGLICFLAFPKQVAFTVITLPALFEHYQEHTQEHQEVDIADFLMEHLVVNHHEHSNPKAHKNLPVDKDFDDTGVFFSCGEMLTYRCIYMHIFGGIALGKWYHLFNSKQAIIGIWQPPRL
jgi:hypothetical protein